ncbi:MAG TPA: hypothetical protein DIW28_03350, partial [Zetaproteobacteria bacterium]|nr:hypothetical protein [Zetaproteobacteria bacterium]
MKKFTMKGAAFSAALLFALSAFAQPSLADNDREKKNKESHDRDVVTIVGPTGPQGPIGLTGAQGPQGLKGDTGATGAAG